MQNVTVLNVGNRFCFLDSKKTFTCTFISSVNNTEHKEKIELHYTYSNTEKHEIICSRSKKVIIKNSK